MTNENLRIVEENILIEDINYYVNNASERSPFIIKTNEWKFIRCPRKMWIFEKELNKLTADETMKLWESIQNMCDARGMTPEQVEQFVDKQIIAVDEIFINY